MTAAPRTGFAHRPPTAEDRRAWLDVLAQTQAVTGRVIAAERVDPTAGALLAGAVVRLKAPFPVGGLSAGIAAEVFLRLARAFVEAGWPAWLAPFLLAGADTLDRRITEDGHAQAAADRRRSGVSDD